MVLVELSEPRRAIPLHDLYPPPQALSRCTLVSFPTLQRSCDVTLMIYIIYSVHYACTNIRICMRAMSLMVRRDMYVEAGYQTRTKTACYNSSTTLSISGPVEDPLVLQEPRIVQPLATRWTIRLKRLLDVLDESSFPRPLIELPNFHFPLIRNKEPLK